MNATSKLRFVERVVSAPEYGENVGKTVRILQQWWEEKQNINLGWAEISLQEAKGEWRDVPIEKENA